MKKKAVGDKSKEILLPTQVDSGQAAKWSTYVGKMRYSPSSLKEMSCKQTFSGQKPQMCCFPKCKIITWCGELVSQLQFAQIG